MRGENLDVPELPDVTVYVERLDDLTRGRPLAKVRLASPFVVRSFDPPLREAEGRVVDSVWRMGKRVVFDLEDELFLVVHLMIAGRFRWKEAGAKIPGKVGLAAFDFENGSVLLTEASPKKRAWIRLVRGAGALEDLDPGGLEPLDADLASFRAALEAESHTLKRSLTDPHLFSGIGNAYSDEILHAARMSPMKNSRKLSDEEVARLFAATREVLLRFTETIRRETGDGFPEKVTAFRDDMAVHGKFGKACPRCGGAVQRISYADNEANYCPACQTDGKLLADRGLSRLLKGDWPKTLEELEERKARSSVGPAA